MKSITISSQGRAENPISYEGLTDDMLAGMGIISITGSTETPAKIPKSLSVKILRLVFDDIDVRMEGLELFAGRHAKTVWKWLKENDVQHLIVHCAAGVSRSPAIAAAVDDCLCGSRFGIYKSNPLCNKHVYGIMIKTYERMSAHE